tara:strand:+ start:823 stop:1092 length:270 start_codon:yes stop_codon:yes gene_type:complete
MDRREFLKVFTVVGATAALAPTSILFAERVKQTTQEIIEYSTAKINHLNDYAMDAVLPSLATLAIYAYTMELIYVILFIFLLITSGIVI